MLEEIKIKHRLYKIISLVKSHQYFDSFVVSFKSKKYFARKYKDTPSFLASLNNYQQLKKYGINIPKLVAIDKKNNILLFKYIDGELVSNLLAKEDLKDVVFDGIFLIYRFARFSKIDLNYMPERYMFDGKELYYVGEEFFAANKDKNLENFGLRYWLTSLEGINHLEELGFDINKKRLIQKDEVNKKIVLISILRW